MSDRQSNDFTVVVPSLPGCTSHGNTVAEALDNIRVAISAHYEMAAGDDQTFEGSPTDALRVAII
jgi:predicted RNase H-like HicB family nuclease